MSARPPLASAGLQVETIADATGWGDMGRYTALVERAVDAAGSITQYKGQSTLVVLLTDDTHMRQLNRDFRHQDRATNVLSFPANLSDASLLGDIALGYETVQQEADRDGKSLDDHLTHLVIHGALHLLGYDHENEATAREMEALEIAALSALGIANPYNIDDFSTDTIA